MAGSFSVTLVRPPGKGVGLRIKGCGTIVSQLDPQSVAARGGLLEGDTIVSINGRDCNTQKTATDHMNELKQRSTATYIVEVRRGPSAIASKRKLEEQAQLEQQATDSSPPPAVETKKKKEVQPPAPEAQPAKAAKAAKAAPTAKAPEATRLLQAPAFGRCQCQGGPSCKAQGRAPGHSQSALRIVPRLGPQEVCVLPEPLYRGRPRPVLRALRCLLGRL